MIGIPYSLEKIAPQTYSYITMGYAAWMKALNKNDIKWKEMLQLQAEIGVGFQDFSKVLALPEYFINASGSEALPARSIDVLHELMRLYAEGYAVWEDREKFNNWMNRKNPYLFDATPIAACATRIGMNEVRNEINRLQFGIS